MPGAKEITEEFSQGVPICPLHPNLDKKIDDNHKEIMDRLDGFKKEHIEFTVKKTLENGYRDKLINDVTQKIQKEEEKEEKEKENKSEFRKKLFFTLLGAMLTLLSVLIVKLIEYYTFL